MGEFQNVNRDNVLIRNYSTRHPVHIWHNTCDGWAQVLCIGEDRKKSGLVVRTWRRLIHECGGFALTALATGIEDFADKTALLVLTLDVLHFQA
jgi:hypothetical protein